MPYGYLSPGVLVVGGNVQAVEMSHIVADRPRDRVIALVAFKLLQIVLVTTLRSFQSVQACLG